MLTVGPRAVAAEEAEPSYSLEGAWYGVVTVGGVPTLSLDTFTSTAERKGVEGTALCAIHPWPVTMPDGTVLSFTGSGHGNSPSGR